jgi:hypothetical protein
VSTVCVQYEYSMSLVHVSTVSVSTAALRLESSGIHPPELSSCRNARWLPVLQSR